jgi:cell division protein FtsX
MLLLKVALRPWKLAPYSQFFSSFAVAFLLLLAGLLFWIQQGLNPVLARLEQEQVITAYVNTQVPAADESKIVDQIQVALGSHAERVDLKMVQAEQFVDQIKQAYPDLGRELEDLGPETSTIVPRYISISGLMIDSAIDKIRAIPGIESADSSRDRNRSVIGAFVTLRWVAKVLSAGLCLALLTGLIHLARTNSYIHRDAVSLLRLLGGDGFQLQLPGILSGVCVGAIGGVLAMAGWLSAGIWLSGQVKHLSPVLRSMPAANPFHGLVLLVLGIGIGLMAGMIGNLARSGSKES